MLEIDGSVYLLFLTYATQTPYQGQLRNHPGSDLLEQISIPLINEEDKRRTVAKILLRLQRYVRGYLPDARIETDEDFSKNPAEVKIRVWWKDEEDSVDATE
ncbi:MAG: hypothetical protein ACLP5V_16230 [Candidatus Bathyarchaeia archaeon]